MVPTALVTSASHLHQTHEYSLPSIFFANMPTLFANAEASSIESVHRLSILYVCDVHG